MINKNGQTTNVKRNNICIFIIAILYGLSRPFFASLLTFDIDFFHFQAYTPNYYPNHHVNEED